MTELDMVKNEEVLLVAAAVTVVHAGRTVLFLCECVVAETERKLPLTSNTAIKKKRG